MSAICAGCWTSTCGTTTQRGRTVPSASSPRLRPAPGHPNRSTLLSAGSARSRSSADSPTSTTSPPYYPTEEAGHSAESHFRAPQHKSDDPDYSRWATLDMPRAWERLGNGEQLEATGGEHSSL